MDRQSRLNNQHASFVSASEACELLNVKPATLYTYVSRGLIHRIPTGQKRTSRYSLSDVLNLKARAEARSGHGPVAADALHWGQPVIQTSISTVGEKAGLTYRGHSALDLVRRKLKYESVAELLWGGELPKRAPSWQRVENTTLTELAWIPPQASPFAVLGMLLPFLAAADTNRFVVTNDREWERSRQIIRLAAAAMALPQSPERAVEALTKRRVSQVLSCALGLPLKVAPHIDLALILGAEHELNASTFAARVAASTRADIYACLSAAVAAHSGPRHGQAVGRVFTVLDEVQRCEDAATALHARLERGEFMPGFGHFLYPHGDPRATPLMQAARAIAPENRAVQSLWSLGVAAKEAQYYPPNIDMGHAMLAAALGIHRNKACSLFLIGRFAGWVAHIIEQREQKSLLRPRAEYLPA